MLTLLGMLGLGLGLGLWPRGPAAGTGGGASNKELREDGSVELREDGNAELRE